MISSARSWEWPDSAYWDTAYPPIYDAIMRRYPYTRLPAFTQKAAKKYCCPKIESVLDLGCGTGSSLLPFIKRGYRGHGIEVSELMLTHFRRKIMRLPPEQQMRVTTQLIPPYASRIEQKVYYSWPKTYELLGAPYNLILAANNTVNGIDLAGLIPFFKEARANVSPGGLFIFDALSESIFRQLAETEQITTQGRYSANYDPEPSFRTLQDRLDHHSGKSFFTYRCFYKLSHLRSLLLSEAGWRYVDVFHIFDLGQPIDIDTEEDSPAKAWTIIARP